MNKTELEFLKNLEDYKPKNSEKNEAETMLLDILYCFCYDYRVMDMDTTSESAWTITQLSPTLSSHVYFSDLKALQKSLYKRSMIFPLVRHFEMAERVKKDVLDILKLGTNYVLKVLLATAVEMEDTQPRYLLNILYLNDLVIFVKN